MNALIAILNIASNGFDYLSVIDYFFVALFIFSLGGLLYLNFKRSAQKKIPLDNIDYLKSSTSFNMVDYELILKNGKRRRLYFGDDFESIDKLKLLIDGK
ncbi:MAG: hypothetical protein ACI9XJ_000384 [Marivirga sp.]|jgi:hypothetical protein